MKTIVCNLLRKNGLFLPQTSVRKKQFWDFLIFMLMHLVDVRNHKGKNSSQNHWGKNPSKY